jgi:hypothetical protein
MLAAQIHQLIIATKKNNICQPGGRSGGYGPEPILPKN